MRIGTFPRRANASPTTFACMLICIRAWHPINGVALPDASPIQPVAGQGEEYLTAGHPFFSVTSLSPPRSAMVRNGEPLRLVHVFYFRAKGSCCQGIGYRRQLHRCEPERGGKRKPYGGTLSQGIKRGTLVKHAHYGLVYVGGTMGGRLSLHEPKTGRRLTQGAKQSDCRLIKLLRWRAQLLPMHL